MSNIRICVHGNYWGNCKACGDSVLDSLCGAPEWTPTSEVAIPASAIPTHLTSNAPCHGPESTSGHDFSAFDSTMSPMGIPDSAFCRRCGKVIRLVTP